MSDRNIFSATLCASALILCTAACSGTEFAPTFPSSDASEDVSGDVSGDTGGDASTDVGPGQDTSDDDGSDIDERDESPRADADADDAADSVDGAGETNACGSEGELLVDGVPAAPGDACGCSGTLICADGDLTCLGSVAANACGGCADLGTDRAPGSACGDCGNGEWVCDGDDALRCAGGSAASNACGGCSELGSGVPGALCDDELGTGLLVCTSPESLTCLGAGRNDCGGQSVLDGTVGAPCGVCGRGRFVCSGRDAVTCSDEDGGLNACGGCAPLSGDVGESCGSCGGTWQCDPANENRVVCSGFPRNPCGGCFALAGGGGPGDTCDDGVLYCDGPNALDCGEASLNPCGGRNALDQAPGSACGGCGDGVAVCADRESVVCVDATPVNACGTCERLSGTPGAECAYNHRWQCTVAGNVSCVPSRRTGVVDTFGGSVRLNDSSGAAAVTLEAGGGSVTEPIQITIELSDLTEIPGYELTSPTYRFLPEGAEFSTPIRVRFGTRETVGVDMWWSERGDSGYEAVESRIDGTFIEGYVDHFSTGFAGRRIGAPVTEHCSDGLDNDGDGDTDCDDDDCIDHVACDDGEFTCLIPHDCEDPRCADDPGCSPPDDGSDPCARIDCEAPLECIAGACIPLFDEGAWPPAESRFSFARSVQVPPRSTDAECCVDVNGDGRIDNGLELFIGALGVLGGDTDMDVALFESIVDDVLTWIFEWRPDGSLWVWTGTNDVDGDAEPDQTFEDRSAGLGVYVPLAESITDRGSRYQFNVVERTGDAFATGVGKMPFQVPSISSGDSVGALLGSGVIGTSTVRIAGELIDEGGQIRSVDHVFDIDGDDIEFGGIEIGGYIELDQIFASIDTSMRECECAGFDPLFPVVTYGDDGTQYHVACEQSPGGGCTELDGVFCENVALMCSFLPSLPSLGLNDVDTDGNGVGDSLSVGVRVSLVGAQIAH